VSLPRGHAGPIRAAGVARICSSNGWCRAIKLPHAASGRPDPHAQARP